MDCLAPERDAWKARPQVELPRRTPPLRFIASGAATFRALRHRVYSGAGPAFGVVPVIASPWARLSTGAVTQSEPRSFAVYALNTTESPATSTRRTPAAGSGVISWPRKPVALMRSSV